MAIRARRHQRGWRLVDLAAAAGVGRSVCSMIELGRADELTVRTVRAVAGAVDLPAAWDVGWQRQHVDRLLDAAHAELGARVLRRLEAAAWLVRAEVSFNHYGERGRIDLLAYHADEGVLLVVEIKTALVDVQDLLGSLDVKTRIAPLVARDIGWRARVTVPAIVFAESGTVRRRVATLEGLFGRYSIRGHEALAWIRRPSGSPTGLLVVTASPDSTRVGGKRPTAPKDPGRTNAFTLSQRQARARANDNAALMPMLSAGGGIKPARSA